MHPERAWRCWQWCVEWPQILPVCWRKCWSGTHARACRLTNNDQTACRSVRPVWPILRKNKSWILHQNNARAHSSILVCQFVSHCSITVLEASPYSPDFMPSYFFLFSRIEKFMCGTHLDILEELLVTTMSDLQKIPIQAYKTRFAD